MSCQSGGAEGTDIATDSVAGVAYLSQLATEVVQSSADDQNRQFQERFAQYYGCLVA